MNCTYASLRAVRYWSCLASDRSRSVNRFWCRAWWRCVNKLNQLVMPAPARVDNAVISAIEAASLMRPFCFGPLTPGPEYPPQPPLAPIPSAVDPHTVERAWFMASRWSAPLYERPGRHGPRLLGSAWVGGGRDGSSPRTPLRTRSRKRRPLHPGAGRSPAGGIALTVRRPMRSSTHGHRPYPHVGARRRSVRGAGRRQERSAQRSRERARRSGAQPGLEPVKKVVTQVAAGMCHSGAAYRSGRLLISN